jgi:hypothetical protein
MAEMSVEQNLVKSDEIVKTAHVLTSRFHLPDVAVQRIFHQSKFSASREYPPGHGVSPTRPHTMRMRRPMRGG